MNKKKVALLNAPMYSSVDSRRFLPLGIASIAASLRNAGYLCDVIDGDLPRYHSTNQIVECLLSYDLIGISATTPSLPNAVIIAEKIKSIKAIPIILGGHCATFMHREIIDKYTCFDAIIRGEGESPFIALCNDFFAHGALTVPFDFLTSRQINGKKHLSKSIAIEDDLDTLPFPVRDGLEQYIDENKIVTISTSRGCPYGCSFCSATNFRSKWRGRSPEKIAEEVYEISGKIADFTIVFVDDNFYIDPNRSLDVLREINIKCKRRFPFVFATRADQIINNGIAHLKKLKDFGCVEIEMGIENGSNSVLERYRKNITAEQNRLAIQMLQEQQINPAVDYILFDPEVSRHELCENVSFLKAAHLWGYDPPLIYERVVSFPGTFFTESHPNLYRENCIISSSEYFADKQALEIYKCLQLFRLQYQNKLTLLIAKIRTIKNDKVASNDRRRDLLWLKVIPYELLEQLVAAQENYRAVYDKFISAIMLTSRLQRYEHLYLYPQTFEDYGL